jgi:hypothetical protein
MTGIMVLREERNAVILAHNYHDPAYPGQGCNMPDDHYIIPKRPSIRMMKRYARI